MPPAAARPSPAPLRAALLCIAAITLARLAFHIFFSPFELTADEAHYWEWSRRLDWSYYSKGPGIALLIRAATELLRSDAEWAIRTVPTISFAIVGLAMAMLARALAPASRRAPLFAALLAMLIPGFQGSALLATIDAPFLACWALATLAFASLDTRIRDGRPLAASALAFGLLCGIGFLVKYTMLLLPLSLILFHAIDPPKAPTRTRIRGAAIAITTATLCALPVVVWNAQRGWPTIRHLLGHLGVAGSDVPGDADVPWTFNPMHPLEFLGAQLALVGPALILMLLALRGRTTSDATDHDARPKRIRLLLTCAGLPILLLYIAISFLTDAEGNWALPAYISLGVLAAATAARAFESRTRPPIRFLWNASLAYGLIVLFGIPALPALERIQSVAPVIPLHRIIGGRAEARILATQLAELRAAEDASARDPFVLADRYTRASLMAYYLHRDMPAADLPTVTSASALLGDRPSSYDLWPETDPRAPQFLGRDAILIGSGIDKWNRFIQFDAIDPAPDDHRFKVGRGYRGPRTAPAPTP